MLLEYAVRAGADVRIRDSKGRTAYDVILKDSTGPGDTNKIRVFLTQCELVC